MADVAALGTTRGLHSPPSRAAPGSVLFPVKTPQPFDFAHGFQQAAGNVSVFIGRKVLEIFRPAHSRRFAGNCIVPTWRAIGSFSSLTARFFAVHVSSPMAPSVPIGSIRD